MVKGKDGADYEIISADNAGYMCYSYRFRIRGLRRGSDKNSTYCQHDLPKCFHKLLHPSFDHPFFCKAYYTTQA